jgi:hypothetical protein
MRIIRNINVYIILLALSMSLQAQQKDFRMWYTIGIEGKLINLIDVALIPELRLRDNSSRFEGILTEADASIPVFNILRFGLNYRYQADFEREDQVSQTNRFGIYAEAGKKIQGFRLSYRVLYHQEYTDINNSELGKIPVLQHRHKISLKYSKKKWKISPSISAEMFFTLRPEWIASQEKLRLSAGIQYALTKKLNLGLGYKFQQEYFESNPLSIHIVSFELNLNLERRKSKYKNI